MSKQIGSAVFGRDRDGGLYYLNCLLTFIPCMDPNEVLTLSNRNLPPFFPPNIAEELLREHPRVYEQMDELFFVPIFLSELPFAVERSKDLAA